MFQSCMHTSICYCLYLPPPALSFPPSFSLPPSLLYSASTDKTGAVWDLEVGVRIKKLRGHTSIVNSCGPSRRGQQMLATGSDDGTIKVINFIISGVYKEKEHVTPTNQNYSLMLCTVAT